MDAMGFENHSFGQPPPPPNSVCHGHSRAPKEVQFEGNWSMQRKRPQIQTIHVILVY